MHERVFSPRSLSIDHEFCRSHHGTRSHRKTEIYITDCLGLHKKIIKTNHQKTSLDKCCSFLVFCGFPVEIWRCLLHFHLDVFVLVEGFKDFFFVFLLHHLFLQFPQKCVVSSIPKVCHHDGRTRVRSLVWHMKVCTADHQLADFFTHNVHLWDVTLGCGSGFSNCTYTIKLKFSVSRLCNGWPKLLSLNLRDSSQKAICNFS